MKTSVTIGNYQILDSGCFQVFDNNEVKLELETEHGNINVTIKFINDDNDKSSRIKKMTCNNGVTFEGYNISKTTGGTPMPIKIARNETNEYTVSFLFSIVPLTLKKDENADCFIFQYSFLKNNE